MLDNYFLPQRRDWGTMGRRLPPWLLRPLLKISFCWLSGTIPGHFYVEKKRTQPATLANAPWWMVKLILITITKPSFNDINLLRSMLANRHLSPSREWGAIAAVGWRRLPWSGCIFLPSFHLAKLHVRCPLIPKPTKTQPLSDQISPSTFGGMGQLKYPFYVHTL